MSLHIKRFVDRVKVAESKGTSQLVLTLQEARDLHGDITKLLADMEQIRTAMLEKQPEVIRVEVDGGNF